MAFDLHAELAKLLDRAPDFRAAGAQFFSDTGPANDYGSVIAEQADDAAKPRIGRAWIGCRIPSCAEVSDEGIMSARPTLNNK